jgi:nucleoside-diphosphate-sugar epimerase
MMFARPARAVVTSTTGPGSSNPDMHCDELIATPINLGSSELVSINELLTKIEKIAGVKLKRKYDLNAPLGVAGRNSDNTFIRKVLGWEPDTPLGKGLAETYAWIKEQYHARKAGRRVGIG